MTEALPAKADLILSTSDGRLSVGAGAEAADDGTDGDTNSLELIRLMIPWILATVDVTPSVEPALAWAGAGAVAGGAVGCRLVGVEIPGRGGMGGRLLATVVAGMDILGAAVLDTLADAVEVFEALDVVDSPRLVRLATEVDVGRVVSPLEPADGTADGRLAGEACDEMAGVAGLVGLERRLDGEAVRFRDAGDVVRLRPDGGPRTGALGEEVRDGLGMEDVAAAGRDGRVGVRLLGRGDD